MTRRAVTCLAVAGLALGAAGCTSTQDKAAALQAQGTGNIHAPDDVTGPQHPGDLHQHHQGNKARLPGGEFPLDKGVGPRGLHRIILH